MTTEAGQEKKAGWPVVTMVRFAEHVRAQAVDLAAEGVWLGEAQAEYGPTGYETERYLPESTTTGLVEALDERKLKALALELPGSVYDDAIAPIIAALSSYKQEVE
jgi:hypothetical protein